MYAAEFVELLGGAHGTNGNWTAHCPAHVDSTPSLSVTEGADRVLVKCQAGCATGTILLELGLTWRDLFHDTEFPETAPDAPPGYVYVGFTRGQPPEWKPGMPRHLGRSPERTVELPEREQLDRWHEQVKVIAHRVLDRKGWSATTLRRFGIGWDGRRLTIPVRDADGQLVSLLRYLPGAADFKMLAPKGAGRYLFPAPERFKVGDLWLVEGEPDAITAFELDLPAVGLPGVGTWKAGWTERFLGRSVTICLDCDTHGRQGAQRIATELGNAGVPARIVDLAPGKHNGYDLGDAYAQARKQERVGDLRAYLGRLQTEAWGRAAA
jgi:hypothetical protein